MHWGRGRQVSSMLGIGAAIGAAALVVGIVAPAGARTASPQHHHHRTAAGHRLGHVFIIMEENHAADHTIGDPNMPFLTKLAHRYPQATKYYGVTHTSEPNYIAATSGSNWGVNNDNEWNHTSTITHTVDGTEHTYTLPHNRYHHSNIVDTLEGHHIRWAAYMDSMPRPGYLPDKSPDGLYVAKHNPFILYNDVRMNRERRDNIKPYTDLKNDLNRRHTPRYVWISPNLCNDLHGGINPPVSGDGAPCPYSDTAGDEADESLKAKADKFLKGAVKTIMHSRAWTPNSVIFVTADENDYDADNPDIGDYLSDAGCCDSPVLPPGDFEVSPDFPGGVYGGGKVAMIVVTPHGRHTKVSTPFNHYSMLRTIEQGFGLPLLGNTNDVRRVKSMWDLINRRHHR